MDSMEDIFFFDYLALREQTKIVRRCDSVNVLFISFTDLKFNRKQNEKKWNKLIPIRNELYLHNEKN